MRALRLLHRMRRGLGAPDTREPGRVNHVSLGSHCHMAQILKSTGLRTWSGPFDWIFSSPGMVRDCLADDFRTLLDRNQLESTPLGQRRRPNECRCRHRHYAAHRGVAFVFNHHDPATSAEDYAFLEAGVRRLRAALADPGARNRFYLLGPPGTPEADLQGICDALAQNKAGNHLTFIEAQPGDAPRIEALASNRPDLDKLRLETRSASVGLRFSDPRDDALLAGFLREAARRGPGR